MREKERFIELRAKGHSYDKIAKELGKAKQTVVNWGKDLKEEVAALKAVELEALYEKYSMNIQSRLESYGKILEKINKEIERRGFDEVPVDKLIELQLKYQVQLKSELIEPMFLTDKDISLDKQHRETIESLIGVKN